LIRNTTERRSYSPSSTIYHFISGRYKKLHFEFDS